MTEFSDVWLRSLKAPAKGQRAFWDDKLACFGVRCSQGGTKTFVLKLRNEFITLGRFGVLSLTEARTEAKRLLAEPNPWESPTPVHNLPYGQGAVPGREAQGAAGRYRCQPRRPPK